MSDSRKILLHIVLPILLAVVCIVGIFLIAAYSVKYNPAGGDKFTQDFYYRIYDMQSGSEVRITGLTPRAAEQKNLLIPVKIDDCIVSQTAYERGCSNYNALDSKNLEKLFLPMTVVNSVRLSRVPKLSKVIMYNYTDNDESNLNRFVRNELYVQSPVRVYVSSHFADRNIVNSQVRIANVSYMYNYDGAANYGYYFIDDYGDSEHISFIPPEPTRAGYKFGGWYKEPNCINEWNFGTDKMPNDITVSDQVDIKLYAKWTE